MICLCVVKITCYNTLFVADITGENVCWLVSETFKSTFSMYQLLNTVQKLYKYALCHHSSSFPYTRTFPFCSIKKSLLLLERQ